jgi:Spy/CpxP family protein refolding chaperone
MKKRAFVAMTLFLTLILLGAQAGQNTDHGSNARKMSKKPTSISGKVGSDGKTLTADKDNKIWQVSNPESLRGIGGRHVNVRAHVEGAESQIRIVSVRAIPEEQAGIKFGDAAFRR